MEAEHPAVTGHFPVPTHGGSAAIPTTGRVSFVPPIDPKNGAWKAKTPPSLATSQYAARPGIEGDPHDGSVEPPSPHRPVERSMEGEHPTVSGDLEISPR